MSALKKLRTKNNLTQTEVAKVAGISQQAYSYIENNHINPRLETAIKIAKYFKKPVEEIFSTYKDN